MVRHHLKKKNFLKGDEIPGVLRIWKSRTHLHFGRNVIGMTGREDNTEIPQILKVK